MMCPPGYAQIAGRCVQRVTPSETFHWGYAAWVVVVAMALLVVLGVLVWRWR